MAKYGGTGNTDGQPDNGPWGLNGMATHLAPVAVGGGASGTPMDLSPTCPPVASKAGKAP